jgi:hypothetical protein
VTEQPTQEPISAVGTPPAPAPVPPDLKDPALYANRELSWLAFNQRVIELAEDPDQPLMERVKFAAIFTSNLDEFFMIRVAGVHDQVDAGVEKRGADGRTPAEVLDEVQTRVGSLSQRQSSVFDGELRPVLADHGVRIIGWAEATDEQRAALVERYRRQIFPVLTPLAVGLGRPFPYISNLSLSLAVLVRDPVHGATTFARVKVPKEMLPRFVEVDGEPGTVTLIPLEDVIAANLDALFPGMEILDTGRLPGHARRRLRGLRRGGRPAAGRGGRAAAAALRGGRARRGRRADARRAAGRADRGARARAAPALRGRRACSTSTTSGRSSSSRASRSCATRRGPRSPSRACRARTGPTCWARCAAATSSSTTPTTRSRARSSASSRRPSATPTCWRSR